MPVDWTASGECTLGSTAPRRAVTRLACGGAETTITASDQRHGAGCNQEKVMIMTSERTSQQAFFGTSALLFLTSAAVTTAWCGSMSSMREMPMPGGWTMSMTWMPMLGRT